MKISLILPSNRSSASAISRIFLWSDFDPKHFELIVRDNSGVENKRRLIESLGESCLQYYSVPPCDAFENCLEALKLATGDFVFFLADDDNLSMRGAEKVSSLVRLVGSDVSGVTGKYLIEGEGPGGVFAYPDLTSQDFNTRFANYISTGVNFLYYSTIRRSVIDKAFGFLKNLPFKLSFHDQLISVIYLAAGKFAQTPDVVYSYDMGAWETFEKSLRQDRGFYVKAGLPIEIDLLHFLLMALEGAYLIESDFFQDLVTGSSLGATDLWFSTQFSKFLNIDRSHGLDLTTDPGSRILRFREKINGKNNVDLDELLVDVCELLDSFEGIDAQRYFSFWSQL